MSRKHLFMMACFIATTAAATASPPFEVPWWTIDAGGALNVTGGPYDLGATIGQPDAQTPPVMTGGPYELLGGFWPVANVCYCPGDVNHDGLKNGLDIDAFVKCILGDGPCRCADVDQANGVNLTDLTAFVADLLSGSTCP